MQFRATFLVRVSAPRSLLSTIIRLFPFFPSALFALLAGCATAYNQAPVNRIPALPKPAASRLRAFGQMPLYFVENRGQVDSRAVYYLHGKDKALYFTSTGIAFVLSPRAKEKSEMLVRAFFLMIRRQPRPPLFPYTTLFRSRRGGGLRTNVATYVARLLGARRARRRPGR